MEAIDARLRESGVIPNEIRTRLDGQDKTLLVTSHELVYVDGSGVRRAMLKDITKVSTTSAGMLTVRTGDGPGIEGSIRGFDVTELKFFFETVKSAVARAKGTATSAGTPRAEPPQAAPSLRSTSEAQPAPQLNGRSTSSSPAAPVDPWEGLSSKSDKQTLELPPLETDSPPPTPARGSGVSWPNVSKHPTPAPATPKADALGYALPDSPAEFGASAAPVSAVVAAPTSDWSGEVLDPKVSLEASPAALRVPTLVEGGSNLKSLARWVRILAGVFLVVGLAAAALSVPGETNQNGALAWITVLAYAIGSLLVSLMAFGVSELMSALADVSGDVRATRRATLGH